MSDLLPLFHWTNLLVIPSALLAYTVHELAHAFAAYYLGDDSQVEKGKITLNPIKHIAWLGLLSFIIFGVGWPKPLRVNPYNFKRKYLDTFFVSISGPVASFTLALLGLLFTFAIGAFLVYVTGNTTDEILTYLFPTATDLPQNIQGVQAWSIAFTGYIAITNFWLAIISLLPLPGLDGLTALVSLVAFFKQGSPKGQITQGQSQQRQLESTLVEGSPIILSQQKRRNSVAEIHFKVGTEFHQENKYDDAIARYRQAISNDQHFGPAYINMGLAHLGKGHRKRAIQSFRGGTQYADDKRSQTEAWYQLRQLSEVTPVDEEVAKKDMAEMGDTPWTDTRPRPNWSKLGIISAALLATALIGYSILLLQLINELSVSL